MRNPGRVRLWRWLGQLVLLFCLAMGVAIAGNLRFERIGAIGGGANPALIQDRQGFIWIGTQAGLHRYDGYRSRVFRHEPGNMRSLPSDQIEALLEDSEGRLWVATRNGLVRFEPATADFSPAFPAVDDATIGDSGRLIRDMVDDGQGGIWLATRGGLQHFDPRSGAFVIHRHDPKRPESLVRDNVAALARDAKGGLWVATWPSGLDYLPPGSASFQHFSLPLSNRVDANVRALLIDSKQQLWIGTDFGITLWQSGSDWSTKKRLEAPPGIGDFRVLEFYEDSEGVIWVGTLEEGLFRWNATHNRFEVFRHQKDDPSSLPSNSIRSIMVDRSKTLWAGSLDGGLARSDLASKGFDQIFPRKIAPQHAPGGNLVFTFADGDDGEVWIGGSSGALLFDTRESKLVRALYHDSDRARYSLSNNYVYHFLQEPGGPLWIATGAGLNRYDRRADKLSLVTFGDSARNSINRIALGHRGVLWLATGGGLIRYDKLSGATQFYGHDPAQPFGRSYTVASSVIEDRSGRVWVIGGRENLHGGVDVLDPDSGRFANYRHDPQRKNSLADNQVNCLFEDDRGDIWLGTANGLSRAVRKADGTIEFTNYRGFDENHVTSVQSDTRGVLWVSTIAGLSSLNPETGEVVNFAPSDGVLDPGRLVGTAFRARDGRIFFGGFGGVTVVSPEEVQRNKIVPHLVITDISVLNRSLNSFPHAEGVVLEGSVTDPKSLSLSWKDSVVSFEFAALHYADPGRNRFLYRLQGFDRGWIEAGADRRSATYTNLDPGHYVFRVKGASKNGVWSDQELALQLYISPPFWKTWWFRLLVAALVLGCLVAFYQWRVYQLTKGQERLERLVEERTQMLFERERSKTRFLASASHDLRQPIQAINLFLCSLKRTALEENQIGLVKHLEASVRSLKGLLDSLLDVSKLDAGVITPVIKPVSLMSLLEDLNFELSPLALDKGLRFKLFFPRNDLSLETDPQLLRVALQNLVSNAIAYTETGGILLAARRRPGRVDIQVWDTGIGVSEDDQRKIFEEFYQVGNPQRNRQKGLGLGLAIVKRTLALLNCAISCRSIPGRGSVFEIQVPLSSLAGHSLVKESQEVIDEKGFTGKLFIMVEDDEEAALGLQSWIRSIGGEVVRYSSAEEALTHRDRLRNADFVISDYRLPGNLSGIDFLNAIRDGNDFRGVLITGDTSPEFIERVGASGWPVLFKPIDPDQLLKALSTQSG